MAMGSWYQEVARVYEGRYDEPLFAAEEWVSPLHTAAVDSVDSQLGGTAEMSIERTADMVAVATYGIQEAQMMRALTLGRKAAGE